LSRNKSKRQRHFAGGTAIRLLLFVVVAGITAAAYGQELLGLRLGKDRLQDVLSTLGLTPLAPPGEALCYAAEKPLDSTWVVFGTSAAGNWEVLTSYRVLSSPPPGMICSRTPLVTEALRQGQAELEVTLEEKK
jgi:hypothetical protein